MKTTPSRNHSFTFGRAALALASLTLWTSPASLPAADIYWTTDMGGTTYSDVNSWEDVAGSGNIGMDPFADAINAINNTAGAILINGDWANLIGLNGGGTAGVTSGFSQNAGAVSLAGNLALGTVAGGTGAYTISGGSLAITPQYGAINVGEIGLGIFHQLGGAVSTDILRLGWRATSLGTATVTAPVNSGDASAVAGTFGGTYNISGGTLSLGQAYIGREGSGKLSITGGETTVSGGSFIVGYTKRDGIADGSANSLGVVDHSAGKLSIGGTWRLGDGGDYAATGNLVGQYNLSGTAELVTGNGGGVYIGNSGGYGEFNQSGGTATFAGTVYVGQYGPDSKGVYNLTGGTLNAGSMNVGNRSPNGFFYQDGGAINLTGNLTLGYWNNQIGERSREVGTGVYTIKSGTATMNELTLGQFSGKGTVHQSGGTVTTAGRVRLGDGTYDSIATSGIYNISGGALIINATGSNALSVGYSGGYGEFNQTGGSVTVNRPETSVTDAIGASTAIRIVDLNSATGTISVSGGTFTNVTADTLLNATNNAASVATFNISGTGVVNLRRLWLGEFANGTSFVNLDGGTLTVKEVNGNASANSTFNFNGGKLVASDTATESGAGAFIAAGIKTLEVKAGGGVIDTNGKNLTIAKGLTGSGDLEIEGGGVLTFSGDNSGFTGAVNVTEGSIKLAAGAVLTVLLDGSATTAAVNEYTFGSGTGIVFEDGAVLNVAISNAESLVEGQTYVFNVFTGATIANPNQVVINTAASGGFAYTLNGDGTLSVQVVPEPSTYAMLGALGLAGVVLRRRRKG